MPTERIEVSAAAYDGAASVIGGFKRVEAEQADGQQVMIAPRTIYAYEPGADEWTTPDSIPAGVNHADFVALDGRLNTAGSRENTFRA